MRRLFLLACLVCFLTIATSAQSDSDASPVPVSGWDVAYTINGPTTVIITRRLLFMSFSDGTGTFRMIGPRTTWTPRTTFPAVWDDITTDFKSFSGEVEYPIGNVGRETGTLIFKGHRSQTGVISGSAIFVSNVPGTATPTPYVIRTGTFIATPVPIITAP
jgi:hypothetical protein